MSDIKLIGCYTGKGCELSNSGVYRLQYQQPKHTGNTKRMSMKSFFYTFFCILTHTKSL